jgi:integrase
MFCAYLRHVEHMHLAASTVVWARRMLARWEAWLDAEGIDPEHVPPLRADEYFNSVLRQRPPPVAGRWGRNQPGALGPGSREKALTCVRAAYRYATDIDMYNGRDPFRRVRVRVPRRERQFFTNDELRMLLAACSTDRAYLMIATFAFTGVRVHELASLKWHQGTRLTRAGDRVPDSYVDLSRATIHVLGKGEVPRAVPIHYSLLPLLEQAHQTARCQYVFRSLRGSGMSPRGVTYSVNGLLERTGLKQAGCAGHSFRRSLNDTLVENARGYDIERRLILGHSLRNDINASAYTRVRADRLAAAIQFAYADDPIV